MPTFLLLLLGLTIGCARAQDSSEGIRAVVAAPLKKVRRGPGDSCEDGCSSETHTFCENTTKTCVCEHNYPVVIQNRYCLKPVMLGKPCIHQLQCQFHDIHTICQEYTINYTECTCRDKYQVKSLEGLAIPALCLANLQTTLKADVPTLLGLGLGMSMLSALICFVLKIFARARFARPRRYADARINPPLTVSETYAAFALAANASTSSSPARDRQHSIRSGSRSASSSRRPSYSSIHPPRPETYAAFAIAATASTSSSPSRDRQHTKRSGSRTASSSRRPSSSSIHTPRPGTRRSSQASLRLVAGDGRGEPIGYYVCIRDPVSVHSRAGSRRPSQASLASRASSSGDLREGRVHHFLYMRAPHHSLTSETTTTTGTSDSSPRTPKSTEQLLAVYHSVPEHSVLELGGVGSSHTTSTLGTSSDDVFQEEDEEEEEEEEEEQEEAEESKARLIV